MMAKGHDFPESIWIVPKSEIYPDSALETIAEKEEDEKAPTLTEEKGGVLENSMQKCDALVDALADAAADLDEGVPVEKKVVLKKKVSFMDYDKISRFVEEEPEPDCERPYRSLFYQLVVAAVLVLALSIAVAIYTLFEFSHLYPRQGSPVNISVWHRNY